MTSSVARTRSERTSSQNQHHDVQLLVSSYSVWEKNGMRHRVDGRRFDRPTDQRLALFRGLVTDLLRYEQIKTTEAKAKEVRSFAEKMITLGKKGSLAARRQVLGFVYDTDVAKKVFDDLGPRYSTRPGGYTRIVKLGPRVGDGAPAVILELV